EKERIGCAVYGSWAEIQVQERMFRTAWNCLSRAIQITRDGRKGPGEGRIDTIAVRPSARMRVGVQLIDLRHRDHRRRAGCVRRQSAGIEPELAFERQPAVVQAPQGQKREVDHRSSDDGTGGDATESHANLSTA